ncbi:MAG: dihydrodipicolinate synthase family protein [Paludisphaera borealis]|uniref:dihydrodipicolinate synthase family protein n=1 Tax=Paludisphaera borealis TaxID=1387353 RepID=UPI0028482E5A|nr:dihydrodipicolinate synthase family protein [Paludisphaera borealis]MDR3622699.1 dihydrodipicolinate synthase family protein [Paludisphaera borealis]
MTFDLSRLDTVQLVPLTPFSSDGSKVLPDVLGSFTSWLYDAGVRVFLPGAATSEFHSLSAEEVVTCVAATRSALPDDAVVIAPIGMSVSHALSIGKGAIDAGADALLVMPPVHPYLCDAGMGDYFRALTDALPLPFLAYKKGPFPSDELLGELSRAGRLVGVKYAVNEVDAVTRFIESHRGKLGVYCGTAERFAPFFHLAGATGYTSGAGNICPRLTLAMHRALAGGDYAKAMQFLRTIRPIEDYRARSGDSYNVSMLKTAIKFRGRDFGPPRPPQRRLTPLEETEVRTLLEPILAAEAELGG